MGVYTGAAGFVPANENFLEGVEADDVVHEAGIQGAMAIIIENEENYNTMMQAVGINELSHFETTGEEIVYEGSTLTDFFNSAKAFFVKMYQKVKGLFNQFMAMLNSMAMSDKKFVDTYRATLVQKVTKDFSFNGYEFTNSKAKFVSDALAKGTTAIGKHVNDVPLSLSVSSVQREEALKKIAAYKEKKEDIMEELRGAAAGKSAKLTMKEFDEEMFKALRSGQEKRAEIKLSRIEPYLDIITDFKDAKKEAKEAFTLLEKGINDAIKAIDTAKKEIEKMDSKDASAEVLKNRSAAVSHASLRIEVKKSLLSLAQRVQGHMMSALKQERRQAKAVCVKLINYSPKNEGFSFEAGLSPVAQINFK